MEGPHLVINNLVSFYLDGLRGGAFLFYIPDKSLPRKSGEVRGAAHHYTKVTKKGPSKPSGLPELPTLPLMNHNPTLCGVFSFTKHLDKPDLI